MPEDVAVVGLDNIEMADYIAPTLTSAGVDSTVLARQLFDLLHARIENNDNRPPQMVAVKEQIFFRESCGCTRYQSQ